MCPEWPEKKPIMERLQA